MVCGVGQNLYVYSLYRNPDLDDRIFDCLLASMAAVQAEDVRASFLIVGDLNGHHQEWLGSTTTNRHGIAAFDIVTVSGCDQLVVGPTHACGGTLDLSCSIPSIVFYHFSLSLLSVYRLVLWEWGLRTDMAYITLSLPCTADLF